MRVGVGSTNPVKRAATERALPEASVVAVAVDSGVPEQPRGVTQTVAGAKTRAWRALSGADLGVGIEGGVAAYDALPGLFLIMWAAVTDGEDTGRASGPSVPLPDAVADRVRAGEELGPVMDDRLDADGVARDQGATGVLTGGRTDRERALATAVAAAAGPVVTDRYG